MEKPPIFLEDWGVVESASAPAWRALEPGRRLIGFVLGHDRLPNGLICTSPIVRIDETAGLVETRNTLYRLGRRNPEYEIWLQRQPAPKAA
jgi:hypothetical protein